MTNIFIIRSSSVINTKQYHQHHKHHQGHQHLHQHLCLKIVLRGGHCDNFVSKKLALDVQFQPGLGIALLVETRGSCTLSQVDYKVLTTAQIGIGQKQIIIHRHSMFHTNRIPNLPHSCRKTTLLLCDSSIALVGLTNVEKSGGKCLKTRQCT